MEEKHRIMIVDDDASYATVVTKQLERTGAYEVKTVAQATLVVAAAREFDPQLILLDIMMPEQDGGETAALLANDEHLRDIPVVFLTSLMSHAEMTAKGGFVAGKHILAKPVSVEKLVETIQKCLQH